MWGRIIPGSFPEHKVLGNKAKTFSLLVCATNTVAYFRCKIILHIVNTASDDSCGGGLETRLHSSPLKPHIAHPSHFPVSTSCLSYLLLVTGQSTVVCAHEVTSLHRGNGCQKCFPLVWKQVGPTLLVHPQQLMSAIGKQGLGKGWLHRWNMGLKSHTFWVWRCLLGRLPWQHQGASVSMQGRVLIPSCPQTPPTCWSQGAPSVSQCQRQGAMLCCPVADSCNTVLFVTGLDEDHWTVVVLFDASCTFFRS